MDEIPYDFIRKRLSVVVRDKISQYMITKGALENVLAACSRVQVGAEEKALDDGMQAQIQERYEAWSAQGYRVLGVAVKTVSGQSHPFSKNDETDMVFAGFLLFFDPPKAGVQETLQALAKLGVRLKVITGDNRLVARHVAQTVGLGDVKVLTGAELDTLRDEALWHAVEETTIFAEVDPNEKERIILALKKRGHVVGYMGDGINDAPSLHSADVGISVANAVDVAKEAADLVLLEQDRDAAAGHCAGQKDLCQHAQVYFHGNQRQLWQYVQHGGRFAPAALPAHAAQADFAHQLFDRPARNDHRQRPRGRCDGGSSAPHGHSVHPPLHAGLWSAQLGVRLRHLRRAVVADESQRAEFSGPAGSSSRCFRRGRWCLPCARACRSCAVVPALSCWP